jgi:hypothetical protein
MLQQTSNQTLFVLAIKRRPLICGAKSPCSEDDAPAGQIVRRQRDFHFVTQHDADREFPHFARRVRDDLMPVFELHAEHAALKDFFDRTIDLNLVFSRHSAPTIETTDARRGGP